MAESKDFVLPNEQTSNTATQTGSPLVGVTVREPMSGKEIMVGAVIVIIGAFMFFFVSRWFTENMIKKRKSPTAASRAGWSLFFFLTLTTALFVFGFLGSLWANWMFIIPMGLFCIVSLAFFIMNAISK
jgi:hypothetical protein